MKEPWETRGELDPVIWLMLRCCCHGGAGLLDRLRSFLRSDPDAQVVGNCLTVLAQVNGGKGGGRRGRREEGRRQIEKVARRSGQKIDWMMEELRQYMKGRQGKAGWKIVATFGSEERRWRTGSSERALCTSKGGGEGDQKEGRWGYKEA